ncbi:serine/threonine-protein phosphatase 6 regulatory ankyrin repeat subunit C-like isoform X2 [Haliotis rufescens]|uniref:serine/threonine-protein phosphatase 6 regulatory ankyrin repeat subunit C-like isoform X2 n=1 Tax=Haliotis rufescens TaxID=6454 RepID=UPI00201F2399|nr:serine/threonine-protein phosphatase 6 regulatory ankyrin repeat subunit C-like isoform X2 [Haliotis rufescens]
METDDNVPQDGAVARPSTDTVAVTEGSQQQGRQPTTTSTPDGAVASPSTDTVAATEGRQQQGGQPPTTSTPDGAVASPSTDTVAATEGRQQQGGQPPTTSTPDGAVASPSTDTVAAKEGRQQQGGQPPTTSTPDGAVARPSTDTVAATEGSQQQGGQPTTTSTPDGAVARRSTDTIAATEGSQQQGAQSISTTTHNYIDCKVSHFDVSNSPGMAVGDSKHQGCISQGCLSVRINQLSDMFVETHALDKAQELLKRHKHVAICGAPGDGKTTAALRICEAYMKKKYQVLFVESIEEFDSDVVIERKCDMLVVFDDVFGSVTFPSSLEKIHRVFNALVDVLLRFARDKELTAKEKQTKKKHDKSMKKEDEKQCEDEKTPICNYKLRFIFTSRSYNWNEGCERLHQFKVNLFKPEAIVDMIKTCLTSDEKKRIMALFRRSQMCDISSKDMKTITQLKDSMFGYPLTCKLYFTNPVFQMHSIVDFFLKPLTYLRCDLDTIVREGSSRSAALVLLVLCGGKLDLVSLMMGTDEKVRDLLRVVKEKVASCTDADISREISNFTGTYCIVENHLVSFSHPSIHDAASCALGNLNIVLLVKYCSLQFLYERVRLSKTDSLQTTQTDDVTNMIQITSRLYPLLISRLVEGIREECFRWTVGHPVFRNDQLASSLMTELANDLPHKVHQKDRTSGECFLYWVSLSNNDLLFRRSLILISKNGNLSHESVIDLNDSATGCVKAGIVRNLQHIVVLLKKHGEFDVDRRMQTNKTQLIIAAEAGHLDVFNFLLQEGANVSMRDRDGNKCLHHACQSGNKDIVKVVVEKFPDMTDDPDGLGNTSAMLCVMSGHEEILKVLVSHGADLKWRDYCYLHMACARCHISIIRYLLSYEDININERTVYEQSPVMVAAEAGHSDVYHLLVSEGADLSLTANRGRDCLMLACKGGNISIVEHLLSLKTFNINRRDWLGSTPVMMAAEAGHSDVYHLLVSEGADLSLTDNRGRDCLMLACKGGNISIVEHLLSLKTFNINRRDWLGSTPVMMAAEARHYDVYHLLVSEGADLSLTDNRGRDCLMLACEGGNISIVKNLLSLKTFNINRRDWLGRTPVMMAAKAGHCDVYHLLVSEGADPSLTDYDDRDCLMLACEGGNMSIVKHLLSLKKFNINMRYWFNRTPVMMAAAAGHSDVFHLLVSEGAYLSLTDYNDRDCLMLACEGGNMSIVKHLLSLKTFNINRRDSLNRTPVMMAAKAGHSDVYHLLVSEGADLSLIDCRDRDCLVLACEGGNKSIVMHLLSLKKFNINRGDMIGSTSVMMAAEAGHSDVYHLLVSERADLSLTDDRDRDCLMYACEGGNKSIVKHLLSLKTFNINRRDRLGITPVMMAADSRHSGVHNLLVSEGADLSGVHK